MKKPFVFGGGFLVFIDIVIPAKAEIQKKCFYGSGFQLTGWNDENEP